MKLRQRLSVCVLQLLCVTWGANGGNILVWYTEGSHWINMKPVLETLIDRSHQVTVLVPSTSLFMNTSEPSHFGYEPFNVTKENMEDFVNDFIHFFIYEMDHMNYLQMYIRYIDVLRVQVQYSLKYLDAVLKSETIMKKLNEGKYDLLLADPIYPGSDLVAEILGILLVLTLRYSVANNWERYCGQLPQPSSFVPGVISKLTDKMDFSQRVWNFLAYAVQDIMQECFFWTKLNKYYSEFKGHPKTRAFITHGGTNGIYEAIYHGVPMVGIPMFADQPDNMVHIKAKGAAVTVAFNFMKTEDLRDAVNAVINEKSYKENAMWLSSIHHDRPMSARDEAVFWIEYTMRNKGAKHLRVQAHELTWYQYHSLDVLAFLLTIVLFILLLFIKTCTFCVWMCCGRKGKTKRKAE